MGAQGGWGKFFQRVDNKWIVFCRCRKKFRTSLHLLKKRFREEGVMKYATPFLLFFLFVSCERFPSNPPKTPLNLKIVFVEHLSTDYVPADLPVEGIAATKVNVLSFSLRAENFMPKALEFFGTALIEGPPECRKHSVYFKTDTIFIHPEGTEYSFNTLEWIESGRTYTLVRPKFPTNEYSPFQGTQGMVTELTITEVWAIDGEGRRSSVVLGDSI